MYALFQRLIGPARSGGRSRVLAFWLALLVVLAPTLGRMHGVLHLPPVVALAQAPQTAVASGPQPSGTLAVLFQHHAVLDCWEFEQLGHDGHDLPLFLWQGASLCPAVPPAWQPSAMPAAAPQRLFEARAPPAQRLA